MRPLNIWIWRDCEPLPIDPGEPRLMRAGMLSDHLASAGHQVRWFNSTFDHYRKRHREVPTGALSVKPGFTVELVKGVGYPTNGSPTRMVHNWTVARRVSARAAAVMRDTGERPDIMVMDLPMPDMALAGVRMARQLGIPSVVSIRDLWPDFFLEFLPRSSALAARPLIHYLDWTVRCACSGADSIVGISQSYLDWGLAKARRAVRTTDTVVPLGYVSERPIIDRARVREALRAKGVSMDATLAVFIGSWGKTYDLRMLAEAARSLGRRSDMQFVLAGGGERESEIMARVEGLSNVVLPGWLDREEIAEIMTVAAVGLAPYGQAAPQGLPNKLFEYMSAGLFQVTTLNGEARDILHEGGLGRSVKAADVSGFVDGILEGVENSSKPQDRKRIKRHFEANYSASKVYGDYEAYLYNIVEHYRMARAVT